MMSYTAACKNLVTTSLEAYHSALVAEAISVASILRDEINQFLEIGYSTERYVYIAEAKTLPKNFSLEVYNKISTKEILSFLSEIDALIEKLDNITISSKISLFSIQAVVINVIFSNANLLESLMENLFFVKNSYDMLS